MDPTELNGLTPRIREVFARGRELSRVMEGELTIAKHGDFWVVAWNTHRSWIPRACVKDKDLDRAMRLLSAELDGMLGPKDPT